MSGLSLRGRLLGVLLGLLLAALLPLGLYLNARIGNFAQEQAARALSGQLAVVARDQERSALDGDGLLLLQYEVFSLALSSGTWGVIVTPRQTLFSDSGTHPRPPAEAVQNVLDTGAGQWNGLQLARAGKAVIGLAVRQEEVSALRVDVLRTYALGAALAFILAAGIGAALLRLGLSPLRAMARRSAGLTAASLSERLPVPQARDEVQTLALTLNAMLARLEDAFMRLEAAEERTRQFAADASHELRTPITSLSAGLELLEKVGDDPAARTRLLLSLRREARRAGRLVGDLLDLNRLEAGEPLRPELIDLSALLNNLARTAADLAPQMTVRAEGEAGVESAPVWADRARLEDALWNLIRNAVAASPPGSEIVLWNRREGDGSALGVRNPGELGAELLPRVFDRFVRGQSSGEQASEGSGLGLAIVRATALAHGGDVLARNLPGGGVEVGLTLPAFSPRSASLPEAFSARD
ncbi:sensor histidine kinase [Deinococcus marmoris]|uniref:histidine kinase n=1 Tax=Deinococcus marmoris TaxID=249408 RepID=A0A1U7NUA0_9DEIO|nr:ATP-binding protein [Deinococcus marmoris]OLV16490.1 periplasmic sensor signal transduction histidine kinase [Deinococcus marmoris]